MSVGSDSIGHPIEVAYTGETCTPASIQSVKFSSSFPLNYPNPYQMSVSNSSNSSSSNVVSDNTMICKDPIVIL